MTSPAAPSGPPGGPARVAGRAGRPVLLDAAATTRCRRRVHLEHDPAAPTAIAAATGAAEAAGPPPEPDPGVELRRADAAAHRAALTGRWSAALGAALVVVAPELPRAERLRRTLEAVDAGASWIAGAELPPAGGRRGHAELLVRVGPSPGAPGEGGPSGAGGWVPVIVVRHRVSDAGEDAVTTAVERPHPDAAAPDAARRPRWVPRDVLRLAHLRRMLETAGLAAPTVPGAPVWGGVVGLDADVVLWADLAGRGTGSPSTLETYDRRLADRLAVAEAARAGAEPLAEPSRITECRRCPWWPLCEAELRARDDVSLVVRGDDALRLRGRGVGTVAALAALDPVRGLPLAPVPAADRVEPAAGGVDPPASDPPASDPPATDPPATDPAAGDPPAGDLVGEPVTDLTEAVALARAWRSGVPLVRRVRRPEVPRGDVEVDIDMESLGEDGAYLWGTLLSGADVGLAPGYRGFATWVPVPTPDEGRSFGAFWAWLADVRARTAARGLTLRAYCYNEQAENRWLRASAHRFAGTSGVPPTAEVEEFIASDAWVDLFPAVSRSFLCPHGKGLKRVAPSAGFAWRDPEAGGENSMRWYRRAVGLDGAPPEEGQRERLLVYNEDDVRATRALRAWMCSDEVLAVPHLDDLTADPGTDERPELSAAPGSG